VVRVQPDDDLRGIAHGADVSHPILLQRTDCLTRTRFLFFALFSVIGKTSAFIGPFVSSAIIDASDNTNMPFAFLFGLGMFSCIFLWFVDVPKARLECQAFVAAERDRRAFGTCELEKTAA
jgi:hypothetical protein